MIPEAREVRLRRGDRKVLKARWRSPVTLQRDLKRVPTVNPRRLTIDRESVDSRRDGRFLQTDLVCRDRALPVAGCIASRNPGAPTPAQRAAAKGPEADDVPCH